jgi:hypothetical protein
MLAWTPCTRPISYALEALAIHAVAPGPDAEGREADPAGNGRDRLPVGTRPAELHPLYHTMGRRAGVGDAFKGAGILLGQWSYLACYQLPSNGLLEGA